MSDAGELDRGSYDKATQDVLDVEFPTWYFSTHGLSRPSTPVEEDKQRSVCIFRKGLIRRNTNFKKILITETDYLTHCLYTYFKQLISDKQNVLA